MQAPGGIAAHGPARPVWRAPCSRTKRVRGCAVGSFGSLIGSLISGPSKDIADSDPGFVGWLQQQGLPPQKVAVQSLPGQGRGLVARQRLSKGELLLQVPMKLVLSAEGVLKESPALQRIVAGVGYELPAWTVLALWLAEQRHLARSGAGSRWAPYLSILPEASGTVLDWRPGEADRWLVGGLRTKARVITDAAAATWSEVEPHIRAAEAAGAAPAGAFSRDAVQWGVGLLLSRSVRLDSASGDTVLVPFADFANHGLDADCYLDYDAATRTVGVRIDRAYAPGEQVLISYGPKSSGELLLSYGFVPPGPNPHEAAFLDLGLDEARQQHQQQQGHQQQGGARKQRPQRQQQQQQQQGPPAAAVAATGSPAIIEAKRAAMAAMGVPTTESFAVRLDALPEGLLEYIAFLDAPAADASEVNDLAEAFLSRLELPVLRDGTSSEALALEGLARRCKQAQQAYPKDAAADQRLAAAAPDGGGFDQREALCAGIRLRERAILARVEFVSLQRAKALRRCAARP